LQSYIYVLGSYLFCNKFYIIHEYTNDYVYSTVFISNLET